MVRMDGKVTEGMTFEHLKRMNRSSMQIYILCAGTLCRRGTLYRKTIPGVESNLMYLRIVEMASVAGAE